MRRGLAKAATRAVAISIALTNTFLSPLTDPANAMNMLNAKGRLVVEEDAGRKVFEAGGHSDFASISRALQGRVDVFRSATCWALAECIPISVAAPAVERSLARCCL